MRLNLIPASGALTLAAALMACGPAPAEAPAAAPKAEDAAAAAPATAPAVAERSADFRRTDPAQADLKLIEEGAEWRVLIRAGGVPRGAAKGLGEIVNLGCDRLNAFRKRLSYQWDNSHNTRVMSVRGRPCAGFFHTRNQLG